MLVRPLPIGDVLLIRCPSKSPIPPNSFIFIEIRASGGVHPPSFPVRWTPCERRTKRRIFLMGYADVIRAHYNASLRNLIFTRERESLTHTWWFRLVENMRARKYIRVTNTYGHVSYTKHTSDVHIWPHVHSDVHETGIIINISVKNGEKNSSIF